jgi:hypothetical protein
MSEQPDGVADFSEAGVEEQTQANPSFHSPDITTKRGFKIGFDDLHDHLRPVL